MSEGRPILAALGEGNMLTRDRIEAIRAVAAEGANLQQLCDTALALYAECIRLATPQDRGALQIRRMGAPMSSLREDLARRLVFAEGSGKPVYEWDNIDPNSKQLYLRMADECIRQME